MKRHLVNQENWNENKKKLKRKKGEAYLRKRKIDGRWNYNIEKEERKLKGPCNCKLSKKNTVIKCNTFSEEDRKAIFTKFWSNMKWSDRKVYASFLVKPTVVKRHRNRRNETISRRKESLLYYMKKEGQLVRVCKQMFLNTHCLKEDMLLDWLRKEASTQTNNEENNSDGNTTQTARYKDMKKNEGSSFPSCQKLNHTTVGLHRTNYIWSLTGNRKLHYFNSTRAGVKKDNWAHCQLPHFPMFLKK